MIRELLWMIYPYIVIAIVGMALVWQIKTPVDQDEEELRGTFSKLLHRIIKALMILSLITGIGVVLFYNLSNDPEKIFYWVKSLVFLNPDMALIENISFLSRLHFMLLLTSLLLLSFSNKFSFILRPYQYFKKKALKRIE